MIVIAEANTALSASRPVGAFGGTLDRSLLMLLAALWSGVSTLHAAEFKGAWFEVWYPDGWEAFPSLPSESRPGGVDSVFLRSPDGAVEFYIFAPQWGGEPRDIRFDPAKERLESSKVSETAGKKITWYTISATNGDYTRSYQDTEDESSRRVVGVSYRSEEAYREHRPAYLKFKKSLRQFAD